jgi:hypothetical protein
MNTDTLYSELSQYSLIAAVALVTLTLLIYCVFHMDKFIAGLGNMFKAVGTAVVDTAKYLHKNYTGIKNVIVKALGTRTAFFHFGVLVCMTASVVHGSHLFINKDNVQALNYLLAATFDIGIWFLMQSTIYLKRQGKNAASYFLMIIIIVLCGFSFAANLIYSVQNFEPSAFSQIDASFVPAIEVLQACPPLVIVTLTLVAGIFTKKDLSVEEVSLQQRLEARNQRKLDRLEYRLKLKASRKTLKVQYANMIAQADADAAQVAQGVQVTEVPTAATLAWSFFGVIKKYDTVMLAEATETQQKAIAATGKQVHTGTSAQSPAQPQGHTQSSAQQPQANMFDSSIFGVPYIDADVKTSQHNTDPLQAVPTTPATSEPMTTATGKKRIVRQFKA